MSNEVKVIDLYTDLVKIQGLLPKSDDDNLNDKVETLKELINNNEGGHSLKKYYEGISIGIYELSEMVRSIVDDIKPFANKEKDIRGISSSKRMKVILLGETSAGKTTFLERILGEKCGETGAIPITAFAVIHRVEDLPNPFLDIKFKNEFDVKDSERKNDFEQFLKNFDFQGHFRPEMNHFVCKDDDFKLYGSGKFDNFIREANKFPEALDEIVWHHKKTLKQSKFTEFADLYDMPGSGGMEAHSDNLKIAISKYDADIVLYLLKSDQGVPSEYQTLKSLRNQFEGKKLYFVYQIINNDSFDNKVEALKEFIFKTDDSDAIEPFNAEEQRFYSNAKVVDARGDVKDKVSADVALSAILQKFYIEKASAFYSSLNMQVNEPKEFTILDVIPTSDGINGHLRKFLEKEKEKCNSKDGLPSWKAISEDFESDFSIEKNNNLFANTDLGTTLTALYSKISDLQSEVLNLCCSGRGDKKKFDPTKYFNEFNVEYKEEEECQQLIYLIQAYHFLILTYKGQLKEIYARKTIDPILKRLEEYINRLKSIENRINVVRTLNEE